MGRWRGFHEKPPAGPGESRREEGEEDGGKEKKRGKKWEHKRRTERKSHIKLSGWGFINLCELQYPTALETSGQTSNSSPTFEVASCALSSQQAQVWRAKQRVRPSFKSASINYLQRAFTKNIRVHCSFTHTSVSYHKTKSDKLQGYWSLQLASINHCDSITSSAASVQMKAAAGALKRQHHKKESFCRRWPHRLAPYHPFTLTTQFATKQQGHHSLVAFIPALRVWLYAAVLSWMIRKSLHISAGTVQEHKSKDFSRKSDLLKLFQHLLIYNLWASVLMCH